MSKIILNGIEYSNGITYQELQPVIYSDEEREIGVWRDGKPLYQKTYHFDSLVTLNSNTWVDTGFKISNSVIVGNSVAFRDDNVAGQSFPVIVSADIGTNQAIELLQTRNSSISISGFTIQYTKTTDVAGSGNWNTDGVPTHHYSTNEQVIGTWIDGKPLYQKTWDFGNNISINSNTWTNTPVVVASNSIKAVIDSKGMNSGGTNYGFIACNCDQTYVQVLQTRNAQITLRYLTLQYTKTTD